MDVAGDAGNSPVPFSQEGEHDPTQQESCNPPINVESMSTPQGVETRETLETTAQTDAQTEAETDVVKKDGRKSIVWKHFGLMMVNGLQKAQCNYCKKLLGGSSRNGTKHLLSHMDTCVPKKMKERGSNSKGQSFLMPKIIQGKQELGAGTYDAENARKELAHAIIMHDYPLSIVDHCGFKRYSAALQPLFQVPSRNTIKKEIFKVYEYERSTTMKLLDSLQGRVTITSDMWTSRKKRAKTSFVKTELDRYLEEDVIPRKGSDFDILMWWKLNGVKYPTLQAIAKDVLAIPVSTVASESSFSTSGIILSPHRSRLHWTTLEALMCARSWLWSAEKTGGSNSKLCNAYATLLDEIESDDEGELASSITTYFEE